MNKKIIIISIMFSLFLSGCMTYTNLSTPEVKQFRKEIMSQHEHISKLNVRYSVPALQFNYSFREDIDVKEMFKIFYKTKAFILSEQFQKSFFQRYFSHYYVHEKEKVYPEAYIHFDFHVDGEGEYQFYSSYYKGSYNSAGINEIDGYNTWRYWDHRSDSKPVPEEEEHIDETNMDAVISDYIITYSNLLSGQSEKQFEAHRIYGTVEKDETIIVYGFYVFCSYVSEGKIFKNVTDQARAMMIGLSKKGGKYEVIDYWEALHNYEVIVKFPEEYADKVMNEKPEDLYDVVAKKMEEWLKSY